MNIIIKKEWGSVSLVDNKLQREFSEYHSTVNSNDIISILINDNEIIKDYKDTMIRSITLSEDNQYIYVIDKVIHEWIYHIEYITNSNLCSMYSQISKEKFELELRNQKINIILGDNE